MRDKNNCLKLVMPAKDSPDILRVFDGSTITNYRGKVKRGRDSKMSTLLLRWLGK
jgi:hypothetical protein